MKPFFILGIILLGISAYSQSAQVDQHTIESEGYELYRLELASWNSSDLLSSIWGVPTLDSIEGYLSYRQLNSFNTIYYGGNHPFRIYAHFVFDSLSSIESAFLDATPRNAAKGESELIAMRNDALQRIEKNENNFFQTAEKTSLNLIPYVSGNERKVVIISGPQEKGNVLFGNDYVLYYSQKNEFISQHKLHNRLSLVAMETDPGSRNTFTTEHLHQASEPVHITSTDLCTLLLYTEYTNWKKHFVISDNFVSIWDCAKKTLRFVTRKEFEKEEKGKRD